MFHGTIGNIEAVCGAVNNPTAGWDFKLGLLPFCFLPKTAR